MLEATPFKNKYQYLANSNINYNVRLDFLKTLEQANDENERAMFEIACMYFYGFASENSEHGTTNYAEASKWLKIILEKYDRQMDVPEFVVCAYTMLANMYYSGVVIREEQSFSKTISMLEKVLANTEKYNFNFEKECEKAIHMMIGGIGISFDFEEILKYLEQHEISCSNNAKNSILKFYMRYGLGGDKNIWEAIFYFEKAACQGNVLCRAELAALYQEPECRDYQKAFKWAEMAASTKDR